MPELAAPLAPPPAPPAPPAIAAALRQLLPAEVHLHHCWIAPERFELHASEVPAVARAVPQRRMEFAAGRHCARRALQAAGGSAPALQDACGTAPALQDAHGTAPALPVGDSRLPQWPAGVLGCITHDAQWCAAAVASQHAFAGLGVDVELIARFTPDLERGIATPAEAGRWLDGRSSAERQRHLALLFCAKEASFKAHFPATRAWLDFTDAEVTALPESDCGSFSLRLLKPAGRYPAGHMFIGGVAWAEERACAALVLPLL